MFRRRSASRKADSCRSVLNTFYEIYRIAALIGGPGRGDIFSLYGLNCDSHDFQIHLDRGLCCYQKDAKIENSHLT